MTPDMEQLCAHADYLAESLLNQALEQSVQCKISYEVEKITELIVEQSNFDHSRHLQSILFRIEVHKQKRRAQTSLISQDELQLKAALNRCIEHACHAPHDNDLVLPDHSIAPEAIPLEGIYDRELDLLSVDEMIEAMQKLLKEIATTSEIKPSYNYLSKRIHRHGLLNSLGIRQKELKSQIEWHISASFQKDNISSALDEQTGFSHMRQGFEQAMLRDFKKLRNRIQIFKNGHNTSSHIRLKGIPIVLAPRIVEKLLLTPLITQLSADYQLNNTSRWKDQLNQMIVSDQLVIYDQPHDVQLMDATAYDDNGLPTHDIVIIEHGVLKNVLIDFETACRLKKPHLPIAGGPFGLHVLPGHQNLEDILQSMDRVLLAYDFSGNCDEFTGDFSGSITHGIYYENGHIKSPVRSLAWSGNCFNTLQHVIALSQECESVDGKAIIPYFMVPPNSSG